MNISYDKYMYIYAYCFITDGKKYFSIYDIFHKKIHLFSMYLYDIAKNKFREQTIGDILKNLDENRKKNVIEFIQYLISNNIGRYVENISVFPLIEEVWDSPYKLKKCIIDIRDKWHDFDVIFSQLSELLCPKIEIRSYRVLSNHEINSIVDIFKQYNFGALYFLLKCDRNMLSKRWIKYCSNIILKDYRIFFNIYNVPSQEFTKLKKIKEKTISLQANMLFSTKQITGREDCGVINCSTFHMLDIDEVIENKLYNGCLNRIISIDEDGYIKNCPSMEFNFGNITDTKLSSVYEENTFRKYWKINNSNIENCKECEMRIVCLNCRAYLSEPNNIYSKPSKCSYNGI